MTEDKLKKSSSAHRKYPLADGTLVVGVTTILNVMAKPALVPWANKLGLAGIEVSKYVDKLADVGTIAHKMIEDDIAGNKTDTGDYSKNILDLAETCFLKWLDWKKQHNLIVIFSEKLLVSEKYRFGGTVDIYAEIDGVKTLLDIKTAKGVYEDMHTQVAGGYGLLLDEAGHKYDKARILRIGRDDAEGFDEKEIFKIDLHKKRFLACLNLYNVNQQLKNGGF